MSRFRAVSVVLALVLVLGTSSVAYASEEDHLSPRDQEVLTLIFGRDPSPEEEAAYFTEFDRVPTDAEISAYLASVDYEEKTLGAIDGITMVPMAVFSDYFQSGSWMKRSGVWSLSLMPKAGGIGNQGVERTWSPVFSRFGFSAQWMPYKSNGADASMYKQYKCHFWYGMLKTPWNLEPHKTASSVNSVTCN